MIQLEGWLCKASSVGAAGALKRYYFTVATGLLPNGRTLAEIRWYKSDTGGGAAKGVTSLNRDTTIRLLEGDAIMVKSEGTKIALHPVDPAGSASARPPLRNGTRCWTLRCNQQSVQASNHDA